MGKMRWPGAIAVSGAVLLVGTVLFAANKVANDYDVAITRALSGDDAHTISSEDLASGAELTTNICENGVVLLKNTDSSLPTDDWSINIFGLGGCDNGWYYQGNGSGHGSSTNQIPLYQAFRDWGWEINESLASAYNSCGVSNRVSVTESAKINYQIREMPVSFVNSHLDQARNFSSQALIVFSRYGGEGNDLPKFQYKNIGGNASYDDSRHYNQLCVEEEQMVQAVCARFDKVYVLFNCCNIMEMGFLNQYPQIKAAMFMPMGGNAGSYAIPKIMGGLTNPSGKLPDTVAYNFTTAPSYANMSYTGWEYDEGHNNGTEAGSGRLTGRKFNDHRNEYIHYTCYEEGIYVGYYWYETAAVEGYFDSMGGYDRVVQYPFGYGLSYTTFSWEAAEPTVLNGGSRTALSKDSVIEFRVDVGNTGGYFGKDVVELYVEKPYTRGGIEKPAVQLVGFAKTGELAAETPLKETLVIRVRLQDIADYDCYDMNNDGHMGYELDPGDYVFSLRTDSHHVKIGADAQPLSFSFHINDRIHYDVDADTNYPIRNRFTTYTNTTSGASSVNDDKHHPDNVCGSMDGNDFNGTGIGANYLSRANFSSTFPTHFLTAPNMGAWYAKTISVRTPLDDYTGPLPAQDQGGSETIQSVFGRDYDDPAWDALMNRLSYEEMRVLVTSEDIASFGTSQIAKINKPRTHDADGPCGFNSAMSGGNMRATNYPSGTMVACTWDYKMSYQFGKSLGSEATNSLGYDGNYGPGLNMHRSPFGGRNFEYYSEDPILSGNLCSWQISGAKEEGLYCYVKHIALNDSDTGRNGRFNFCTEQAFRQIYAKPFEIISKGAKIYDIEGHETQAFKANAAMASVDRIGTTRTTGSYNFLTEVVRNEWGFRGSIITDYYQAGSVNDVDEGIRSGNDLMLNGARNCVFDDTSTNTYKYYVRQAAKNILFTYADTKNCLATSTGMDIGSVIVEKAEAKAWWKDVLLMFNILVIIDLSVAMYFAWSPTIIKAFKKKDVVAPTKAKKGGK